MRVSAGAKPDAQHPNLFATIQSALDHAPEVPPHGRLTIEIAPGTYRERIYVSQLRPRTTLLGLGTDPSQVVITAGQNASTSQSTFFSESAEILADDFQADNVQFENSAGATGQALAISVTADRAIFKHCRFIGYQDTIFSNYGRQYFVDSFLSGAVDFIFGNATAVFERDEIHIVRPGYLTAQSRTSDEQTTGYVILRSRVTADPMDGKKFQLGRPWRSHARVVFMETELPASLDSSGWSDWGRDPKDVFFAEYHNSGPGAAMSLRPSWVRTLTDEQSKRFEPRAFLAGTDGWDPVAEAAKLP